MDNFNQITDNIFLGNIFSLMDENLLTKINCIISCIKIDENIKQKIKIINPNIDINELVFDDDRNINIEHFCKMAFPIIEMYEKNNILINCLAGKSRSASIVIYYLMIKNKMTFEYAFNLVKNKRDQINLNKGFYNQLSSLNIHNAILN